MLALFNQFLTCYTLFPALVALGVYLTFRLRFLQIGKVKMGFKYLFQKEKGAEGNMPRYQAIASVLAGNFGTGNISGMAVALMMGGSGALVWMWIMAFFGSIIQYSSCLLAMKYREQNEQGEFVGGPMYYISNGLGMKRLGRLFAFLVILGAIAVGVFCQINSMSISFVTLGIAPWVTGVVVAAGVGIVLLGGAQRVAKVAAAVIPFVAVFYMGSAIYILGHYWSAILPAFGMMFKNAFAFHSILGGAAGFGMMQVVTTGIGRALFATDVGTGYVPILQAGAKSRHYVVDGAVALVAPLLVMIVCTITSLVLIVTGADQAVGLKSTAIVVHAFQIGVGRVLGSAVVNTALLLFGYTTILAWACCFERAVGFLVGCRWTKPLRLFFIGLIPLSAFFTVNFVWAFADIALALMTLVNLIGIFGLSREVVRESRDYFLPQQAG
ncbi:MAG: sodium:alanine symporter family protein [Chlamydiales bacterium]|nr:sodium:alanine symporter family protein [Chlamydiales bacterium]